jgi:hypothetical protein
MTWLAEAYGEVLGEIRENHTGELGALQEQLDARINATLAELEERF